MSLKLPRSSDLPEGLTRAEKRAHRSAAFKRAANERFIEEIDRKREAFFAQFAVPAGMSLPLPFVPQPTESVETVANIGDGLSGCECDPSDPDTLVVPLPIATLPLQNLTQHFYDMMVSEVPDAATTCSFEQLNNTVQLQLLNKIYPPEDEPLVVNETTFDDEAVVKSLTDVTNIKVALPDVIQRFIASATDFEVPVEKVPNGAFIRTHNGGKTTVKKVRFQPELIEATKSGLPPQLKSRFYSIYDFSDSVENLVLPSGKILKSKYLSPSDAAATAKLLAKIPSDAHSAWKTIGLEQVSGSPEMNYLMYGPLLHVNAPCALQIRDPPPPNLFPCYRLAEKMFGPNMVLYQLFSDYSNAPRMFEANYRRIMERSKVQKIFRDLRRIPMNNDRTVFLKY